MELRDGIDVRIGGPLGQQGIPERTAERLVEIASKTEPVQLGPRCPHEAPSALIHLAGASGLEEPG
jgi:hypothetical protein